MLGNLERPKPPVVGALSEEKREEIQSKLAVTFTDNRGQLSEYERKRLALLEYPKQPFEEEAMAQIDEQTNNLLLQAGVTPYNIPKDNIYIIPRKLYQEIHPDSESDGATDHKNQFIIIDAEKTPTPLERVAVLCHEMIHLKNHLAIEAGVSGYDLRRKGLEMNSTYKKDESIGDFTLFTGINEAVVATLEKKIYSSLIQHIPFLQSEIERVFGSDKGKEKRHDLAKKNGVPEDEIIYIHEDTEEPICFGYFEVRRVLDYVMTTIARKLPEEFQSTDDVFRLFIQAHFGGQLLPLARAIKKVFGEDALRVLGMMSTETNSARMTLDYFQKKGGRRNDKSKMN